VAEAAFAVDDHLHGQGIATLLFVKALVVVTAGFAEVERWTGARMLQGYRGRPAADVAALRDIVLRVPLAEAVPENQWLARS
jgi:hypothetical protein